MRSHHSECRIFEDRYLLIDDTDENASELLTVICDGDPRSQRGFDFESYASNTSSRWGRA